jgi:type IV secretion system pilin
MINKKTIIFLLLLMLFSFGAMLDKPSRAQAEDLKIGSSGDLINVTAGKAGVSNASLTDIAAQLTKTLLGLMGVIFFILILYGGFKWMTAAGNDDTIKKAKKIIISAVIGLAIVTAAYSIAYFVSSAIETSVTPTT